MNHQSHILEKNVYKDSFLTVGMTFRSFQIVSHPILTYSFPLHHFSTPRKQKTKVFRYFQVVERGSIENEWVNFMLQLSLYSNVSATIDNTNPGMLS